MAQVISLNFGLVHHPPEFNYDFDFADLDAEIKAQLPGDTADVIQMFSEEVMPHLQDMWPEWENRWWIKPAGHVSREAVSTPGD